MSVLVLSGCCLHTEVLLPLGSSSVAMKPCKRMNLQTECCNALLQVSRLITQLPALQQICTFGCPIEPCTNLDARFPQVNFAKTPTGTLWELYTL